MVPSEYWRVERVAAHFDVSVNTVRRWIGAGRLTAVRAGGVRVSLAEIERFAADQAPGDQP